MWIYEKKLEYPVKIKRPDSKAASIIISQLGGPDGELGASMRYLNPRYSCPNAKISGILTDVGTEELAHIEIVAAILHQLTRDLTPDQIAGTPFATYFVDHTLLGRHPPHWAFIHLIRVSRLYKATHFVLKNIHKNI